MRGVQQTTLHAPHPEGRQTAQQAAGPVAVRSTAVTTGRTGVSIDTGDAAPVDAATSAAADVFEAEQPWQRRRRQPVAPPPPPPPPPPLSPPSRPAPPSPQRCRRPPKPRGGRATSREPARYRQKPGEETHVRLTL